MATTQTEQEAKGAAMLAALMDMVKQVREAARSPLAVEKFLSMWCIEATRDAGAVPIMLPGEDAERPGTVIAFTKASGRCFEIAIREVK